MATLRNIFSERPTRSDLASAFALAAPASLAAMITPVLGLIDSAVLTRGGSTADVAGVALAGAVFSLLYWSLGFLRMSVAGLVAQADGRNDEEASRAHLLQGLVTGFAIGLLILAFRGPITDLSVAVMGGGNSDASPAALAAMGAYIETRLLAAPFAIAFFAGVGYLSGQGKTGQMMMVVVAMTAINAGLDIHFVMNTGLGATGIALGTAIAEAAGLVLLGASIVWSLHQRGGIRTAWSLRRAGEGLRRIVGLNADIFLRTFALAAVFLWFTRAGAAFGDVTVAANQILMQVLLMAGLLLDGPAIAAETMVGKALGAAKDRQARFAEAVRTTTVLATLAAVVLTFGLLATREQVVGLIAPAADNPALFETAVRYSIWAAISPLILLPAFHLDGVYIGATRGAALRNSMIAATALFAVLIWALKPMGNHGLWLAFGGFMMARAVFLLAGWDGFARLTSGSANATTC